ncbi:hypothetical protein LguiA_021303 [Lonicera macranthoides]
MDDEDGEEDYVSGSLGICKNGVAAFASDLNTCETELRSLFMVFQLIMTKYEKVNLEELSLLNTVVKEWQPLIGRTKFGSLTLEL